MSEVVLEVKDIYTAFGSAEIHKGISFSLEKGTINALIGGSGSGKSTLLKVILELQKQKSGEVHLFGKKLEDLPIHESQELRNRYGVLFQNGALFSALTVGENIAAPLVEHTNFNKDQISQLVQLRLSMVGLASADSEKLPSELSGGMRKRVALARALALEPEVLFLDEPTSGLDPINARAFDQLIQTLSRSLELTVLMVTHDLDSILSIADRVLIIGDGKLIADGPVEDVTKVDHPWIKDYFSTRQKLNGGEKVEKQPEGSVGV